MTRIRPFRALRYDPDRVDLSRVLVPPFDVITPADRLRLWDRDPHCAVRLVLTRDAGDEAGTDYADVAARLSDWRAEGVLRLDGGPALYLLRQRFETPEGATLTRDGFFAALHLEDYAARIVRPHERTLAGPKADRLKLLRATRTNLSSVFFLYEDPDRKLEPALSAAADSPALARCVDEAGIEQSLHRIDAPGAVEALCGFLGERPVVIADGHHRYETALAYRDERRREEGPDDDAPWAWTLAYFTNAYGEGSQLRPIHRVVLAGAAPDDATWQERLPGWRCERVPLGGPEEVPERLATHLAPHQGLAAFAADDGSGTLRVFVREAPAPDLSVRVIHREVIDGVFGLDDQAVRNGAIAFPKDTLETARMVWDGRGCVALYLLPLDPEDVFRVTEAGEVMPQKSTFYHPKLPTGLVFRTHDEGTG